MKGSKKSVFINTPPQANTRKDGTQFHTVLVGIPSKELKALTGLDDASLTNLRLQMEIFPEKVDTYTAAFKAARKRNGKLILEVDELVVTEVKPNVYVTKDGKTINGLQASVWGRGMTELTINQGGFRVSQELLELMLEDEDDEDGDELA